MTKQLRQQIQTMLDDNPGLSDIIQIPRSYKDLQDFYDVFVSTSNLEINEIEPLLVKYYTNNYLKILIFEEIKNFHEHDEQLTQIIGDFNETKYTLPRSKKQKIELLTYLWDDNIYVEELRDTLLRNNIKISYLNKIMSKTCTSKPSYCKGRSKLPVNDKLEIIINDISRVDKVLEQLEIYFDNDADYNEKINYLLDFMLDNS